MRFSDFVTLQRGFDLPKSEMRNGPYPVIGSTSTIGYHDEFKVEPPGVITGRSGSLGVVQYVTDRYWPHNTSLWVKDFKGNDPKFVYYCMKGIDFARFNAGAGVPTLNRNHLDTLEINIPPLPIQRRIAGILSAYDELIENSQRRIRILEEMARALYREWFVHFRFPGHESTPRVASPLGEIPAGWEVRKLGELIGIDKGVSYNGAGLTEDGNPMVNLKNILAGGGFRRDATKPYSGDFKPRHTVKPGDIILANTDLTQAGNVVASAALVPRLAADRPILISHHLYAVRLNEGISAEFVYHLMLEDAFRGFAKGYAIGTTVLGLSKEGVLNFDFAFPPGNLIAEFSKQIAPVHQLIETIWERVDNLRRTRDLLLPRLLSGQVDVEAIGR